MSCTNLTLAGLAMDCNGSIGGITKVYIAKYEDVEKPTVADGDDVITNITMKNDAKFKSYYFRKGMANFTSTYATDDANGTSYVQTDLNITFNKMETRKRVEMSALSVNELAVIVKDANGIYWYMGYNNAVTASAGTGETGSVRTDANKYSITLQDFADTYLYEIKFDETFTLDSIAEETLV